MNRADNISNIVRVIVGVILLIAGALLFAGVLRVETPAFWLATLVTLVGVFTVVSVPTVGVALMGIGVFMLLRDFGIIAVPWLGYGFSIFLIAIGLYGILASALRKGGDKHDTVSKPSTKRKKK